MSDNTGWLFFPYMAAVEIFQIHLENKNISKSFQLSIPFLPTPSRTFLNQLPLTSCVSQNSCPGILLNPSATLPLCFPSLPNFLSVVYIWAVVHPFTMNSELPPHLLTAFPQAHSHPSSFLKDSISLPTFPRPSLEIHSSLVRTNLFPLHFPSLWLLIFFLLFVTRGWWYAWAPSLVFSSCSLNSSLYGNESTQITLRVYLLPNVSRNYGSCRLNIFIRLCCSMSKSTCSRSKSSLQVVSLPTEMPAHLRAVSFINSSLIPIISEPPKHFVQTFHGWQLS